MIRRTPVRKKRSKPRRGRVIDKDYKEWIAKFPCIVCAWEMCARKTDVFCVSYCGRQHSPTEVAHVGPRGLSQKCSDRETVPLCATEHHREGRESIHVLGKNFWKLHGLNLEEVLQMFKTRYESERAA